MSKKRSIFATQVISDAKRPRNKDYGYLKQVEGVKVLNIEDGTRRVSLDFLPYVVTSKQHPDRDQKEGRAVVDSLWYKLPFKTHRNIGANSITVVCPRSFGKPCPICEAVRERLQKGADWDDVKDTAAKDRNLYLVIPKGLAKHDESFHVWDMSHHLFQKWLNEALKEDEECGVFPDLQEGKTLQLKLHWKEFGKTTYPEVVDITFTDRDPYPESILKGAPSLDELLIVHTYEELQNIFSDLDDVQEAEKVYENEEEKEDDIIQEEEETRQATPVQTNMVRKPKAAIPKQTANTDEPPMQTPRCPAGHRYGLDNDLKDDCETCNIWDDCYEYKKGTRK
jgi:hypothetical protein